MKLKTKNVKQIHINGSNDGTPADITFELFTPLNKKKMSSTWFPQLLGEGGFNPKGDKLLSFWGMTQAEPFDDYYTVRGEVAERELVKVLQKKGYKVKRYSAKEYDYDYFKHDPESTEKLNSLYKYFSGLPDIVYTNEKGEEFLLEVKSKEHDKMEKIIANLPDYEILQGEQLALLYGLDTVGMTWVFFKDDVVRNLYMATTSTSPFDLEKSLEYFYEKMPQLKYGDHYEIHKKDVKFSKQEVLEQMKEAYKYAETFRQTLTVNMADLSKEMVRDIFNLEREINEKPKRKG